MIRILRSVVALTTVCLAASADDSVEPLVVVRNYRVPAHAFPVPKRQEWHTDSAVPFVPPPIPSYLYLPESNRLIVRGTLEHQREAKSRVAELWRKSKAKKPRAK